jgi:hypothetical protein
MPPRTVRKRCDGAENNGLSGPMTLSGRERLLVTVPIPTAEAVPSRSADTCPWQLLAPGTQALVGRSLPAPPQQGRAIPTAAAGRFEGLRASWWRQIDRVDFSTPHHPTSGPQTAGRGSLFSPGEAAGGTGRRERWLTSGETWMEEGPAPGELWI